MGANSPWVETSSLPNIQYKHVTYKVPDVINYNHTRLNSFGTEQKRRVHMTPEQTSDFYAEHYGKMFFPSLVAYMSNGPILAIVLARQSAISYWRQLIGPTNTQKARDQAPER